MLSEYRLETLNISQYMESVEDGDIKVDQAVQRAFCWSNEMINNLIYSTVATKRVYIPNIILAEENHDDGTIQTYVVDGGQRTEAIRRFIFDGYKITRSIRNRYIEYQDNKVDENGKVVRDENGDIVKEIKVFDLVNKTYDDFPKELKKRMGKCKLAAAVYQDCTPEETSDLVLLYNSTVSMSPSQKALTYIGAFAERIKKITTHDFLINGTTLSETDKKKGNWERTVSECVMAARYFEDWKKNPKDICKYLNDNAKEEDFSLVEKYFDKLSQFSNKLQDMKIVELFSAKNLSSWMLVMKELENKEISNKVLGKFLSSFDALKGTEIDGSTWLELENNKHTKDKKLILAKANYINKLLSDYINGNPEIDEEKKSEKINSDDSEMETIDFVKKFVDPDCTDEDIDDYFGYIESCVKDLRIVKPNSPVLAPENENAIIAVVAYAYKHDIDMDLWLQRYSVSHKTFPTEMSQEEKYKTMLHSLANFLKMQKKVGVSV